MGGARVRRAAERTERDRLRCITPSDSSPGRCGRPTATTRPTTRPCTVRVPAWTDTRSGFTAVSMTILKPLPRSITRPVSILILVAWVVSMAVLVNRSYLHASSANLATDLARYGSNAEWRGVYYRGDKIGFTVSQTVPDRRRVRAAGGRPAADVAARRDQRRGDSHGRARRFELRAALVRVLARSRAPARSSCAAASSRCRTAADARASSIAHHVGRQHANAKTRELAEVPVLSLNFSRLLAGGHLVAGLAPAVDDLRSRDAAERSGDGGDRRPRSRAQHRRASDPGVPRRDGIPGPATRRRGSPTPATSCARRARSV